MALKILTKNYGSRIKFASIRINLNEDWLEVAPFVGLLTQEEAEQVHDLVSRGRTHFFIPDGRAGEVEPGPVEPALR
jgi:hypothetical protein